MKLIIISLNFVFSFWTYAVENRKTSEAVESCDIFFKNTGPCSYKQTKVNVEVEEIAQVFIKHTGWSI